MHRSFGAPENASRSFLGAFSVSLAVADLALSKAFYAKLGFAPVDGIRGDGWAILRNGTTTIGLFQGMFERNPLTFNPGGDATCNPLGEFSDVRELQKQLKADGIGILLISHDIHDVMTLCDRASVMKNGQLVGTVNVADVTDDDLLGMIILGKHPGASPSP